MMRKTLYVVFVFILIVGFFIVGAVLGYANRPAVEKVYTLFNKEPVKSAEVDFSSFWKTWGVIESKYVFNDGIDNQKMVWGAIEGLVSSLNDPYSVFLPPQDAKQFQEDMQGDFGGAGMEIGIRKGILTVISPLKGTPAEKAGIRAGDMILAIDEKITSDMTLEQAVRLIRGEKNTSVKLSVLHKGEDKPIEIIIIRDIIQVPVLSTENKPEGIFVIKVHSFSGNSTIMFRNALREFVFSGSDKLIIDLRNNPGGYLESAIDIASWFLPMGKVVAREKFSNGEETIFRSKGYNIFNSEEKKLPVVILVNEGSASASEILAGALQEHGVARLVGQKTFGKGSVQELISITDDTFLKLTVARWLTPTGKSISEQGLEPDIKIELNEKDIEAGRDPQMDKAIEMINN